MSFLPLVFYSLSSALTLNINSLGDIHVDSTIGFATPPRLVSSYEKVGSGTQMSGKRREQVVVGLQHTSALKENHTKKMM